MLLVLLLLYLQILPAAANVSGTLPDSSLVFSSGWQRSLSKTTDNFLLTDTLGHALTVTIPESTAMINFVGLKRTGGSLYGVCLDCASGSVTNMQLFSGHDSTLENNADAEPALIFSLDVNPDQAHVLQVTNVGDSSFGKQSELTFISIVVQEASPTNTLVPPSSTSFSSTSTRINSASPTSSSTTSETAISTSVAISTDSTSSTASVSATASSSTSVFTNTQSSSLLAVIVVPTVIAVLSLVIGIFFYFRKQRRKAAFVDFVEIEDPPTTQLAPVISGSSSGGFLAMAGRQRPPVRLLEPYPYDFPVSQDSPIFPVRRLETA
ncbi:MAG: hypothetical protein NXY57DRAFT_432864 [Lentinula lateritia]|uniref:Mid2 domain-containing protein n=1 Tax=Lentinula lateritia TaxID=40482 RepID=A0ABQ8VJP0_9AGAR|nr:MAG: hypothetical protein NXY57DRAFT_432864 [Lentinula lateritia]KAJ4494314.1 hypothetical protein C8R41DRAFT_902565 [Lentinula lateritia]